MVSTFLYSSIFQRANVLIHRILIGRWVWSAVPIALATGKFQRNTMVLAFHKAGRIQIFDRKHIHNF